MMILRSTGAVIEKGAREGISKRTNEAYSIPYVVVELNDFVRTTLNVVDGMVDKISEGDMGDFVVETSVSNGYERAQIVAHWPTSDAAKAERKAAAPRPLAATGS